LYFDYIKMLHKLTPNVEDRESFEQVQGLLRPLQMELAHTAGNGAKRYVCVMGGLVG
jgi:son of sevenless-like protein